MRWQKLRVASVSKLTPAPPNLLLTPLLEELSGAQLFREKEHSADGFSVDCILNAKRTRTRRVRWAPKIFGVVSKTTQ